MRRQRWIGTSPRLIGGKPGLVCMILLLLACAAKAQDAVSTTASDEQTPLALAPGAPAGSYVLSGFDNVNLFNGNLNFALPLLHIGGRGEADYTMVLAINSKGWNVRRSSNVIRNSQGQIIGETSIFFTPQSQQTWNPLDLGYSAGTMVGRGGGQGSLQVALHGVCSSRNALYQYTYTRLTFTTSAGEMVLLDKQTGGQPQAVPSTACADPGAPGFDRGRVFVSGDGSAATFIADSDITDTNFGNSTIHPSGYLFLANGLRYRIDSTGQVTSIQDRNGNQVTFTGLTTREPGLTPSSFTITDPLGRQTRVDYNTTDAIYGFGDRITYPGFNNASRVLFISRTSLSDALRLDQTLKNYTDLFDVNLNGAGNYRPNTFNPTMLASALYLPDGRRYRFLYNSYGELARVELPTGGAIEYDMTPDSGEISNSGPCSEDPEYQIYRRVAERRTLPDGHHVESKTRFSESTPGVVTVDHVDPNQADLLLTREIHYFNGNATTGLFAPRPAFTLWSEGKESQTDIQDGSGHLLRSTTFQFQQGTTVPWFSQWLNQPVLPSVPLCFNQGGEPANNPHNHETDATLADVTPNQTSKQVFTYDQFNNVIQKDEFDYGASSATRTTVNTYLTSQTRGGVSVNYVDPNVASPTSTIHLRRLLTTKTIKGAAGGTLAPQAVTNYSYDEDGSTASDDPGIVGHDTSYGTAYQPRGNMTSLTRYINASALSGPITGKFTYDIAGNIVSKTDPLLGTTQIAYDSLHGAFAFETSRTLPVPDRDHTGQASSVAPAYLRSHDYSSGLLTSRTDANGKMTSYGYTDPLDRLTSIARPDGGTTTYIYGDTIGDLNVHTLTSLDGSRNLESYAYLDGLGRSIRRLQFDGTAQTPWVATETSYDAMGRTGSSSNPHRVSAPSAVPDACSVTVSCSTITYDALSRETAATTADGQSVTTAYSGNRTRVTDQALLTKDMFHDALGRLAQVTENPTNVNGDGSPVTTYSYDALDDLVQVTQDAQHRFFMYDSLGRRAREFSPEEGVNASLNLADPATGNSQWSSAFTFDNNGNQVTTTAAGGTRTTYTYDALNRRLTETYSDTTPPVTFFYDGKGITSGTNVTGRLTKVSSTVAFTTYDNYDAMGRVLGSTQNVDNQSYSMQYQYDQAGNLISEQYPSGRIVVTGTDAAGRPISLTSSLDMKPYADQVQYSAHGGITNLLLGNGFWEHVIYDGNLSDTSPLGRFQPTEIGVGTSAGASDILRLQYDYQNANGKNNGNVQRHWITAPGNFAVTQLALYDGLNRLAKMQEVSGSNVPFPFQTTALWEQDFMLDRWGNRTGLSVMGGLPTPLIIGAPAIDQNTNRIVVTATNGYGYDGAGNLASEPVDAGTNRYTYDANNHLTQSQGALTANYNYDGLGHRVKKTVGTQSTVFIYDFGGHLIAEYSPIMPTNGTRYMTQDIVGSTRLLTGTDVNGHAAVVARYDYLPYGEIIPSGLGSRNSVAGYGPEGPVQQLFTGKEKDSETNLDYFLARYSSNEKGRFTSPDQPFIGWRFEDPQTLNLYAYVGNNPLVRVDPLGHASDDENLLERLVSLPEGFERRTQELPPEKGERDGGQGEYTAWLFAAAMGQNWGQLRTTGVPPPDPREEALVRGWDVHEGEGENHEDDWIFGWLKNLDAAGKAVTARENLAKGHIVYANTGEVYVNKKDPREYTFEPWSEKLLPPDPNGKPGVRAQVTCGPEGCWNKVIPKNLIAPSRPGPEYYKDSSQIPCSRRIGPSPCG